MASNTHKNKSFLVVMPCKLLRLTGSSSDCHHRSSSAKQNISNSSASFLSKGKKVRLSPCFFNRAPRHEGVLGEWRYSSTHSLTSAPDGSKWSASCSGRFTCREGAPDTHWIGGWVGPLCFWVDEVSHYNNKLVASLLHETSLQY
jgi:hypothetical protein